MQNKTETVKPSQTEPRKLQKPVREQELGSKELVTYTDESGSGSSGGNDPPVT